MYFEDTYDKLFFCTIMILLEVVYRDTMLIVRHCCENAKNKVAQVSCQNKINMDAH